MYISPDEHAIAFAKYNLSTRALNALRLHGINSPEELQEFCKDNKLIHLHNVGAKTCAELSRIIPGSAEEQSRIIDAKIEMYRRKNADLSAELDMVNKKLAELERIKGAKRAR